MNLFVRENLIVLFIGFVELDWSGYNEDNQEEYQEDDDTRYNQNPNCVDEPEAEQVKESVTIDGFVFVRETNLAKDPVDQDVACLMNVSSDESSLLGKWSASCVLTTNEPFDDEENDNESSSF